MISVLIPVYNYNIVALVTHIHTQLQLCNVPFEIICLDDASTTDVTNENDTISKLECTSHIKSKDNLGRTNARQYLSKQANYDWLLFLDADVMPKSDLFIRNYLNYIESDYEAIYGGFAYHKNVPDSKYMLRWTYGKTHEQISAQERNKKPYKVIISANFMIKKPVFSIINSQIEQKGYGFDNYFGALLKMKNIKVIHLDNEVYHLGIETSETYLNKKKKAAETLLTLYQSNKIGSHQNDLLHFFIKLKRYRLHVFFSMIYKLLKTPLKNNLLSSHPSMTALQLYRICYLCYKDLNP
ncbi:glycosyltransferase family 2 protein [Psychroserpens ponticola]|uniref:Glycosyltransferase n=1 Tax=Psychroserpens ponticola TaxID=2932268 RepID=A0ABY7RVN9_9FLAO|nr:glycosyltransferase [Psychroserpens ponticola]WCO00827.1 glycosyltransferase [Psychroserpens ponticola]